MITLFQWPSKTKLPNSGMFCLKLESYLRLQKIPYKAESTIKIEKSPKKTMPYIERNGKLMADSQLIIEMLEREPSLPMDSHLTPVQKSQSTAYRLMLENQLVYIVMYYRWIAETGWHTWSRQLFDGAPGFIRVLIGGSMRKDIRKLIHGVGVSRHSEEEILNMAKNTLSACSVLIGEKKYAFGDKVSTLDTMVFSVVANILWSEVPNPLIEIVKKDFPNLEAYSKRLGLEIFGKEIW
jgi:glutathione S-transferase